MKTSLLIFAVCLIAGCHSQPKADNQSWATKLNMEQIGTENEKQARDNQEEIHDMNVINTGVSFGVPTGDVLQKCYDDGYDNDYEVDTTTGRGSFVNSPKLDVKYIEKCDQISKETYEAMRATHEKGNRK